MLHLDMQYKIRTTGNIDILRATLCGPSGIILLDWSDIGVFKL